MKKVAILGSTGSIGTQALEVISYIQDEVEIVSLAAGNNIKLLKNQIEKFSPKKVSITNKHDAENLKKEFPNIKFYYGDDGLIELATDNEIDTVLVAVSGKIGLKPTIEAIKKKKRIALANKETLVIAGDIVMNLAKKHNAEIIPVDSEHSAIFQCLNNNEQIKPKKLIITASGGPFLNKSIAEMNNATANEALKHPKWNMGKKITIDSATLMNKGLEVIEAHHLFNMNYNDINVVIHPQSIIHSAIEHNDGSIIAQLGVPSMHIPIQYALLYPQRVEGIKSESFDFVKIAQLTFEAPDFDKFKALRLAFEAGKKGKTYPCVLNAANEEAVLAFLKNEIKLNDIVNIVEKLFNSHVAIENATIDELLELDEKVRKETQTLIKAIQTNNL